MERLKLLVKYLIRLVILVPFIPLIIVVGIGTLLISLVMWAFTPEENENEKVKDFLERVF